MKGHTFEDSIFSQIYDKNFYTYVIIGAYLDVFQNVLGYLNIHTPKSENSEFSYKVIKLPLTESNSNSTIGLFNKEIFIESNQVLFFTKDEKHYIFITEGFFKILFDFF